MIDSTIPPKLRDAISRELDSGERVEWSGMPRPTFFNVASTGSFLFAIPWTAFAIFWTAMASQGAANVEEGDGMFILFPLFGVPFILIGFGLLSAPIWTYRRSLRTAYAITDQRAITIDGGWSLTIRSYPPEKLKNIFRKERSDGSGDVIISHRAWRDSDGDPQTEQLGFLRIENAKDVERRLNELAEQAS